MSVDDVVVNVYFYFFRFVDQLMINHFVHKNGGRVNNINCLRKFAEVLFFVMLLLNKLIMNITKSKYNSRTNQI